MQTLKEDLLDGAKFILDQIIRPFQTDAAEFFHIFPIFFNIFIKDEY